MGTECVIFVGLPASGKTTFYQQRFAATHLHVSKDLWPNSSNKTVRQARELAAALAQGRSVVVDNTSPDVAERATVIAAARAHGARVIGYYFASAPRDSLRRNRTRAGKARVPDVAIFATAKRLMVPSSAEGFDELYQVAIEGDGRFDVRPLETAADEPSVTPAAPPSDASPTPDSPPAG